MSPTLELLRTALLTDFPSGSSINYHDQKFYLVGDDATHILILDAQYQKLESVHLFDHAEKRIPKTDKTDLEGSTILAVNGGNNLLVIGSASRKNRKRIIMIPLSKSGLDFHTPNKSYYKTKAFVKRIKSHGIEEVNLEGVCSIHDNLLLGNRGNRSHRANHLIITDADFFDRQDEAKLEVKELIIPASHPDEILGLSELCYLEEYNLLLLTLTTEHTMNAFDDGAVGNSYLGWIERASDRLRDLTVCIDGMISLDGVDPVLANQKIEGICVEQVQGAHATLHLIADNDTGESRLFKLLMKL